MFPYKVKDVGVAMSPCRFAAVLCLTVSVSQSQDNCLGPGFTETIPAQQECSKYSTTVLKPGDAVIYSSLSFACNGTLQSLTIPFEVRGSVYKNADQYLYIWVSIWRFNETGYYSVREFCGRARTILLMGYSYRMLSGNEVLWNNVMIGPRLEILARDVRGFRLVFTYNVDRGDNGREKVYQHLPLLYKPGPSPGTFTPIVSAKLVPSSGPVTGSISGIIAAVCQVEVAVVAIVTRLIVHFVTKCFVKQNPILSQGRSGNTAELGPVRTDNSPLYDPVGLGGSAGEPVELHPSPAYQATSVPEYL